MGPRIGTAKGDCNGLPTPTPPPRFVATRNRHSTQTSNSVSRRWSGGAKKPGRRDWRPGSGNVGSLYFAPSDPSSRLGSAPRGPLDPLPILPPEKTTRVGSFDRARTVKAFRLGDSAVGSEALAWHVEGSEGEQVGPVGYVLLALDREVASEGHYLLAFGRRVTPSFVVLPMQRSRLAPTRQSRANGRNHLGCLPCVALELPFLETPSATGGSTDHRRHLGRFSPHGPGYDRTRNQGQHF